MKGQRSIEGRGIEWSWLWVNDATTKQRSWEEWGESAKRKKRKKEKEKEKEKEK